MRNHSIQQNVAMILFANLDDYRRADDDAGRRVDRFAGP